MEKTNKTVESNKVTENKEQRSVSPMYATTRFANTVKFLKDNKFIDEEDVKKLAEIHEKMVKKFVGLNIFE